MHYVEVGCVIHEKRIMLRIQTKKILLIGRCKCTLEINICLDNKELGGEGKKSNDFLFLATEQRN